METQHNRPREGSPATRHPLAQKKSHKKNTSIALYSVYAMVREHTERGEVQTKIGVVACRGWGDPAEESK